MEQTVEPRTAVGPTRRTLHGVAECLLAGPQHRATGELALRITANWREGLDRIAARDPKAGA